MCTIVFRLPVKEGLAGPDEQGAILLTTFGLHFMVREARAHGAQVQPSEPPSLTKAGRSSGLPSLRRSDEIHAISGPSPEALPSFGF